MSNIIDQIEKDEIARLTAGRSFPDFRIGDTVRLTIKMIEGRAGEPMKVGGNIIENAITRTQNYVGVVIAKKNRGLRSSFKVLRTSGNQSVERLFPLYSPLIVGITIVKRAIVRRAKLYYLRSLRGKAQRMKEDIKYRFEKDKI
jgi:large subunit ribosomal protein L19